jgi:hypothetical protein
LIGKGQSERIKEEKGNEKGTKRGEQTGSRDRGSSKQGARKGRTAEGQAENYHHVSESFVSRIPGGRRGLERKRRDGEEGGRMKKKRESERERKEGRGRR